MRMVILALILLISPASALTLNGHIQMLKRIDIFLGHESGFMSYNLTNENYTICISDGSHYRIKPDENGKFSVELPKGTYRIWVNITLQDKNTSVVADVPYLYLYPSKNRPILINLTNDTYLTIKPNKVRWSPPEPITPNTRLRIIGHVYNPERANLTVKLYMTNKSIYCLKIRVRNETFEFKNVLPAKNYTIEVIPNEITLNNGSKVIYKRKCM